MNKSTILANINGFITAVITQLKVRNSFLELVNNLWSTTVTNTKSTSSLTPLSITTPLQADINYELVFKRIGNIVHFTGYITNNASTPFAPFTDICNITNANYQAKAVLSTTVGTSPFTGQNILLDFSTKLRCTSSIPAFSTFYFNGSYFTND